MRKPTISQYLLSTCLFAIDELNEQYKNVPKEDLKKLQTINIMKWILRLGLDIHLNRPFIIQ